MSELLFALEQVRARRKAEFPGEPVVRLDPKKVGVALSDHTLWMSITDLIDLVKAVLDTK